MTTESQCQRAGDRFWKYQLPETTVGIGLDHAAFATFLFYLIFISEVFLFLYG
jgi:hypothetical protein